MRYEGDPANFRTGLAPEIKSKRGLNSIQELTDLKADLGQRLLVTFGPKSDRKRKVDLNQ
jgi:hypothetical protein